MLQASQLSLTVLMILGERREGGMERNGRKARDVKTDTVRAGFQFRIFFLLNTFATSHFTKVLADKSKKLLKKHGC